MNKRLTTRTHLAVLFLLILAIVFGYLLTPLGFEPRNPDLRSYVVVPFFIIASLGIPIAATVLLFFRAKITGILVIVNAIIMLFLVAGDQGGYFFTSPPPVAISILELFSMVLSILFLLLGPVLIRNSK